MSKTEPNKNPNNENRPLISFLGYFFIFVSLMKSINK